MEKLTHYLERVELEYCTISLRSDGIIENRFLWEEPYEITSKDLLRFGEIIKQLSKGTQKPILVIAGLYGSMTAESRDLDISGSKESTLVLGLVIQSLAQRLLANFYFKIKSTPYPVKFFKNEEDAVEWLLQQYDSNKEVV